MYQNIHRNGRGDREEKKIICEGEGASKMHPWGVIGKVLYFRLEEKIFTHKKNFIFYFTGLECPTPEESGNMEPTEILQKCLKKSGVIQE